MSRHVNSLAHLSFCANYSSTGKPLPCKLSDPTLCVDQSLADTVYRLGNWEYSYQWRDAVNSTLYSALHYGAFVLELKDHLNKAVTGSDQIIYRSVFILHLTPHTFISIFQA